MKKILQDMFLSELTEEILSLGEKKFRAAQIYAGLLAGKTIEDLPAVPKALKDAGLTMDDIGLIELNEAFAAQSLGCIKLLGWEDKMDIINVNGGAIALGHPVGSSGCRIIVSLVHEMKRRGVKYGLATLCIAGGMGQATVVELCD